MIKHDIQQSDIETSNEKQEIIKGQAVAYKRLFWWERQLAGIIAKNFRVKFYYNNRILDGERRRKSSIIFFGFENDVKLAKEMYVLAYDAISKYSERYVKNYYQKDDYVIRSKAKTKELKNSYMLGFLTGLNEKFDIQVREMQQEFGLMVITPKEVSTAYNELAKSFSGKAKPTKIPSIGEVEAYHRGRRDGEQIDYLKQTIDDDITDFS